MPINSPKTLVVANWKMYLTSLKDAESLVSEVKKIMKHKKKVEVVLCPAAPHLVDVAYEIKRIKTISLGSQDMSWQEKGAQTGQISPLMLQDVGATYAILGHSEVRALGETDEMVNKKVRTALAQKITPIVCIGEQERDENGFYLGFIQKQVEAALAGVSKKDYQSVIFAYEPIWAIGKSAAQAVTPHNLHEMSLYIKKVISDLSSKIIGMNVKVLYGGSVEGENAGALLSDGGVDGFLVGHASVEPKEFKEIVNRAETTETLISTLN